MENNRTLQIKEKSLKIGIITIILVLICILSTAMTTHAAAKNAWVKKSGKTYYYNGKGKKVTGLKKIKGSYYYFNKKGVLYKKGWKIVKGSKYYFAKTNGKAYKGIKTISGKKYLFSTKCKLYGTGINAYGGKKYYTVKGMVQTGWKIVSGKTYYFNTNGIMQTGKWIDKVYYVNADGVMQKNCWIRLPAGNYYVDANGKKLTGGWVTIGDYKYYFTASGRNTKTVRITGDDNTEPETKEPETQEPETKESESETKESETNNNQGTETETEEPETQESETNNDDVIENTVVNRILQKAKINDVIRDVNNRISNLGGVEVFEEESYSQVMAIVAEALSMVDNYNSYTATELYNYYNELAAKDCLSLLKVKQVLTYYPDQSKAIFDAINEYRESQGLSKLLWSINSLRTTRLEAGYHTYLYDGSEEQLSFLRCHQGGQISCVKVGGRMTTEEIMTTWKNSPGHDANLKDNTVYYGSVAYYTYSDSSGKIWSKCVVDLWSDDSEGLTHATPEYYDIILNCITSSRIYE